MIKTNYQACQVHSILRESPAYLFFFSDAEVKNMVFFKNVFCLLSAWLIPASFHHLSLRVLKIEENPY